MMRNYYFENGKFIIRNFNEKSPFTGFLPGIAGLKGRPVWAFYINRGQGVAGFGTGGKEAPIMEFSPAETAYAISPRQGFRTFLRIDGKPCEPFCVTGTAQNKMEVYRSGFSIEENSPAYNMRVEYFGVPNRNFAALGRIVYYTNNTGVAQQVEMLDGIAQILPFGISNYEFKDTGNLLKSWAIAEGADGGYSYIKMRSSSADCANVDDITGGNFFLPVGGSEVIVDPKIIFGEDRTKTAASVFNRGELDGEAIKNQCRENKLFCSFARVSKTVKAGERVALCTLIGYADDEKQVKELKATLKDADVIAMKEEADREAEKIASRTETCTAYPLFDEYIKQSYFDNVLRGGMPVTVGGKPYYVYSRKHGDPERDYNAFHIEPKPYSCGNGNFRDVAQNRRNDIFITPECCDFNVKYFFSLLQPDGYNPLSVTGVRYTCKQVPAKFSAHEKFLKGEFTVGGAVTKLNLTAEELDELISVCDPVYDAAFGEGYWTDHFVYLIDLVNAYLSVYPERQEKLLYKTPLKWFLSGVKILPRNMRAVKCKNGKIRRLRSLEEGGADGWAQSGGSIYETSLAAKLLFLAAIKLATLDPLGCGVDMEAGKPGWCDALNGLPALFGSNVADGVELLRLVETLEKLLSDSPVEWAEEQNGFFQNMLSLLESGKDEREYYELSNDYKENYLTRAYAGFGGAKASVCAEDIRRFLKAAREKLIKGLHRAEQLGDGWTPTYIAYEVETYSEEGGLIIPQTFTPHALPHFAEGVAKGIYYKGLPLYKSAKSSAMYDRELGLFRTSEPLDSETLEIGRIRSFPAGWLERESCFLHMSYKLLLALLKAGLYKEFYEELHTGFVPFMKPERYGRSVLENSSFIATSNYSDSAEWGKGFQARLTGANAEVLSMWRLMAGIEQPFKVENGELVFTLSPKFKKDFFADGRISFTLFGKIKITYVNRSGKNAWECKPVRFRLNDGKIIGADKVCGKLAENVRACKYDEIEVELK